MDFGSVLYKAQKNEQSSRQNNKWYSTTFAPPKKEQREKKLSANIQKFLARKEEEEKRKKLEAERKKQDLLALRNKDKKSFKRVQSMLKRTKSANKSVIDDAVDNVNTAVTAVGPLQPDEDDYGYVSKDASDLYNKLINKYSNMPTEEPLFSKTSAKSSTDIMSTKDRVKAALQKEEEEKLLPRKRKSKSKSDAGNKEDETANDEQADSDEEIFVESKKTDKNQSKSDKFKIPKRNPQQPPPIDFQALLKLAQQKQFEPIMVEKKVEEKPDRLMTEKEKQEFLREKERKLRREGKLPESHVSSNNTSRKETKSKPEHKEKEASSNVSKNIQSHSQSTSNKPTKQISKGDYQSKNNLSSSNSAVVGTKKVKDVCVSTPANVKKVNSGAIVSNTSKTNTPLNSQKKIVSFAKDERRIHINDRNVENVVKKQSNADNTARRKGDFNAESRNPNNHKEKVSKVSSTNTAPNKVSKPVESNLKPRPPVPTKNVNSERSAVLKKPIRPGNNMPIKQFPPPDMMRKKPQKPVRRKFIESDDEYDSEMDDFIDDSEECNVSNYISEIFGYDRSKYSNRNYNDDDDDSDECMESNFSELQKEEYISTKYGIMEDLADIRREKMLKSKKARLMS